MSLKGKSGARAAVLATVVGLVLFCGNCGDTYRPVANPVLQPGGDPQRTAHAVVVSSNGSNPGAAIVIDVSGDTAVGLFTVGRNPVNATFISGTDYIVNQADHNVNALIVPVAGSQTDPSNSIITLPGPTTTSPNVPSASPVFAAAAGGKLFVTEPGMAPPMVADVSPASNSVSIQIPVGNNPVALVATPDGTQLYCLNKNDGTVTVIFPATDQVVATLPVGSSPVWGAVSSDGTRVFVVNQGSNNVSVIDTATDTVIQPNNPLPVGAGPNYITYQASLNRFYVTSPSDKSLSIINNNVDPTQCALTPSLCVQKVSMAGPPCNAQHPISVTALADGTRVYVADDVTNSVCALNTTNNTFTKSIPVGTAPVFIASNSDSTRVYTANSGSADVSIIQTSSDTTVLNICAGPTDPGAPCTSTYVPTFIAMTP